MKRISISGKEISFIKIAETFCAWYDRAMKPKSIHFRIRPFINPFGGEYVFAWVTDEDVYRVLQMPKVGKRMGFGEFQEYFMTMVDYDKNGELLGFGSALLDYIVWAQSHGIYIEFEEGELMVIGANSFQ